MFLRLCGIWNTVLTKDTSKEDDEQHLYFVNTILLRKGRHTVNAAVLPFWMWHLKCEKQSHWLMGTSYINDNMSSSVECIVMSSLFSFYSVLHLFCYSLRCRQQRIIPKRLKLGPSMKVHRATRILQRALNQQLNERVQQINFTMVALTTKTDQPFEEPT